MKSIGAALQMYSLDDKGGHITREFQDYAYRLAVALNDLDHTSLYMRMAKTVDRAILEQAKTFVLDANARNKAKLFMWKVHELKQAKMQGSQKGKT